MFYVGRLRKWWVNRSRDLYRYYDGFRWRRADPIVVGRKLEEACKEYADLCELIHKDSSVPPPGPVRTDLINRQKKAAEELTEVSRAIFNLATLTDDGGLTDGEAFRVLTGYFRMMEDYAKEASIFH